MGKWQVWHKDGSKVTDADGNSVALGSLTYSGEWMGACNVSADYRSGAPVEFVIGDWVEYRGERFVLEYAPGVKKQARRGTSGEAFVYDGLRFDSLQCELVRCDFTDLVPGDNGMHWTGLSQFSFYMETLDDLLDRVQACLDELYGQGVWALYSRDRDRSTARGCDAAKWDAVYGASEKTAVDGTSLSFSDETCWDALAKVNSEFDVNFTVKGREVFVGTAGVDAGRIFKYGKGKGLGSLEKTADSEQYVVTRLKAYGSSKNLPDHYYADLGVRMKMGVTKVTEKTRWAEMECALPYLDAYFTQPRVLHDTQLGWVVKATFDGKTEVTGFVERGSADSRCRFYSEVRGTDNDPGDEVSAEKLEAFKASIAVGATLYLTEGFDYEKVPSGYRDYSKSLPNNMAVNRLMLPGFPTLSLKDYWDTLTDAEKKYANPEGKDVTFSDDAHRPWIQSANAAALGVRPASVMFDTEDKKDGIVEIYPTIEEMTVGGVRIDEVDSGSSIKDDGRFDGEEGPDNFDIRLRKEVDFDLNEVREDDFTISMKDGPCGGRSFEVRACRKNEDGRWRLTLGREKDSATGLWFPYKDYQIKAGDHFVLTGLKMPKQYVDANALKLLRYAIAYLADNDYTKYTYTPEVDEIMMARQHDEAMADKSGATRSLHDTLKEGGLLTFEDTDLGIGGSVTIAQLTIKEEEGQVATYEVTLREEKEVGRMEKMQGQIDSLTGGNGFASGVSLGLTSAQVRSIVEGEGGRHFLSKTKKDTAGEVITFSKGLDVGTYAKDMSGASVDAVGNAEVESLAARGKAGVGGDLTVGGSAYIGEDSYIKADGTARLGDADVTGVRSRGATEGDRTLVGGKGFELYRDAQGKSHLWVDNANIRGQLTAAETEIRKVSYSGGTMIFSNAGSRLVRVTALNTKGLAADEGEMAWAWKCWAAADDGTTQTMNWWKVGDMALCKTFNVSGTSGGNRYYWRMVIGTGQELLEDGRLYDYVVLSNLDNFGGSDPVCPVNVTGTLATSTGEVLTWGGVAVSMVTGVEMTSFAEVVKAQLGTDTDDDGTAVAGRKFYGFDPTGTAVPQVGDVIVQAGNEVAAVRRGNAIKLATSADDSDARTAPSLTMYHAMGRRRKTDAGATSVWQWKTVTAEFSPLRSYVNSAYFLFFSGDELDEKAAFDVAEKFKNADDSFADLTEDIEGVNGRVDDTNSRIDATDKSVSELDGTVKTVSGQVAQLRIDQESITSRVGQVETASGKLDERVKTVEVQTSEIRQTATEVALSVSRTAVGRTNLFVGSGLRRQDEGASITTTDGSGISVLQGYEGTNSVKFVLPYAEGGSAPWLSMGNGILGGTASPNIRIPKKGAKYTFACLAKGDDGAQAVVTVFYKATAADADAQRKTMLGQSRMTFASGKGADWQLLALTKEIPADAEYDYLQVYFSATHTTVGAKKTVWLCRPTAVQADGWYGWGWSEKDYDYIGGNMLGGTRLLQRTGNLTTAQGSWAVGGYGGCTTIKATAGAGTYKDVLAWTFASGTLALRQDYMLSFMARGTGTLTCYMYLGDDVKMTVETSDGRGVTDVADGNAPFVLQSVWTRHTVHWRNTGTTAATKVIIRAMEGTTVEVAQPKLELGATATDWTDAESTFTEDRALGAQLRDTGIDIVSGKIDMTADKFTLRNNAGEKTLGVDDKGNVVAHALQAETADGTLDVTISEGALVATAKDSGAKAYFGLKNGLPCLIFTDAMGNVTYTIGANGESSSLQGNGLRVNSAVGVYSIMDSTDGLSWVVTYQTTVEIENTTAATWSISEGDLTVAVSGFNDETLKGTLTNGLKSFKLNPGTPETLTLGKTLLSQTVKKKNADGSLNVKPTGGRGYRVLYNDKLIGTGTVTKG